MEVGLWLDCSEGLVRSFARNTLFFCDFFSFATARIGLANLVCRFIFRYFWAYALFQGRFWTPQDWVIVCQYRGYRFAFVQTCFSVYVWLTFRRFIFWEFNKFFLLFYKLSLAFVSILLNLTLICYLLIFWVSLTISYKSSGLSYNLYANESIWWELSCYQGLFNWISFWVDLIRRFITGGVDRDWNFIYELL